MTASLLEEKEDRKVEMAWRLRSAQPKLPGIRMTDQGPVAESTAGILWALSAGSQVFWCTVWSQLLYSSLSNSLEIREQFNSDTMIIIDKG